MEPLKATATVGPPKGAAPLEKPSTAPATTVERTSMGGGPQTSHYLPPQPALLKLTPSNNMVVNLRGKKGLITL